jgi:S-adenosylhomocysteine hydrolase
MKNGLPLLNYIDRLYPQISLDNVLIIACQHVLETTTNFFEAIIEKGVKPENIYLIGKCYSTNKSVFNEIRNKGINISDLSLAYDSHESFDEQFHFYIKSFCLRVKNNVKIENFQKIIILDDGGELILTVSEILEKFSNVVGIEQTASGYEKIKSKLLNFPIINVAKSNAKLQIESPFIAEIVVEKLRRYFEKTKLSDPRIMVVGQGAIGRSLYDALKNGFHTVKYDIVTHEHPFPGEYEKDLCNFDVIIGATGSTIINQYDLDKLKPGVLLVSSSSSDREFPAAFLRSLVKKSKDCHEDVCINGFYLANSGFPINFDGSRSSVSAEKIQFTRALLFAAVLEGFKGENLKNEIVELNDFIQKEIVSEFNGLNMEKDKIGKQDEYY